MLSEQVTIWNNTEFPYPRDTPVHALIEAQANLHPDKVAIVFNGISLSYRSLNESANRLSALLLAQGIQKEDPIGLAVERSTEMLVALLAILKTGAAYIPIDPGYPEERVNYMLENAQAKLLITSQQYRGKFSSQAKEIFLGEALTASNGYSAVDQHIQITPANLAYIIYTSGSTGRPKGVMVEHGNLVNLLCSMQHAQLIHTNDRLLAVTTISFDIAALEMFLPLIAGATVVIASTMEARDGQALIDIVQKENITLMQATPFTWKIMLAAGWNGKTKLKILCCGEPLSPDLAASLLSHCDKLYNYYGPTETTIYSTGTQILPSDKLITIGGPIGNTQIHILDGSGHPVSENEEGEIYIGGDGVARGYKNLPDNTAEHFVADPFAGNGRKMFRTGDLGKWMPDGRIFFMGRIDQQVKIRGYRIELGEIETALRTQKDIRDAVVTVREDTPDNKILVAYIVTATGQTTAADITKEPVVSWKNALQQKMPDYMVPHEYVFMQAFPLLPNGKINRTALPRPDKHIAKTNTYNESGTEKLVTAIWETALDIEGIGLDEDFFELGGHSLIAVQIMTRLEKETGKRLSIAALFAAPTVRALADFIDKGDTRSSWGSLVPVKPMGSKPPVYIVHGDGLNVMIFGSVTKYLDNTQPVFGLQPRGLDGEEEPDETIEKIAAFYITAIRKQNPGGPYFLAGYSFGGIVAFEMAKQLQRAGQQVQMLAMFDTNVGNVKNTGPGLKRLFTKIALQFPKMKFILGSLLSNPAKALEYQWLVAKRKWAHFFGNDVLLEEGQDLLLPHEKKLIETHVAAYEKYVIEPYDGRIDLFRVKDRIYFVQEPVYLGWKKFAKMGVAIHVVPGDHRTFLLPPNDKIFGSVFQSVIDERIREIHK